MSQSIEADRVGENPTTNSPATRAERAPEGESSTATMRCGAMARRFAARAEGSGSGFPAATSSRLIEKATIPSTPSASRLASMTERFELETQTYGTPRRARFDALRDAARSRKPSCR